MDIHSREKSSNRSKHIRRRTRFHCRQFRTRRRSFTEVQRSAMESYLDIEASLGDHCCALLRILGIFHVNIFLHSLETGNNRKIFNSLLTELPSFMKGLITKFRLTTFYFYSFSDILDFNLANSGILSALPYLTMSVLVFFSSFLADYFQVKAILTTTQVRRYFNCSSFLGQTVFMMLAAFMLHPTYSVVLLTIGVGIGAFSLSGFTVNHLDIAPDYSSILMGISNTFGTVPGIVSPLLTGYIVSTPVSGL